MTSTEFLNAIKNPSTLHDMKVEDLQQLLEKYPYCATLRMLILKKQTQEQHPNIKSQLAMTSMYAPDRSKLYQFINHHCQTESETIVPQAIDTKTTGEKKDNETEKKTKIETKLVTPPPVFLKKISTNPPSFQKEIIKAPATEEQNEEVFPVIELPTKDQTVKSIEDWLKEFEPVRIHDKKKKVTSDKKPFKLSRIPLFEKEVLDFLDAKSTPKPKKSKSKKKQKEVAKEEPKTKEDALPIEEKPVHLVADKEQDTPKEKSMDFLFQTRELLDNILKREKVEVPKSKDRWEDESTEENNDVISETLAHLLAVQGQNDKAIKMYQALSLKFPEKSTLFADKIAELNG